MLNKKLAVIVAAAALAVSACSDNDARSTVTGPAALRSNDNPFDRAPFVGINPTSLTSELIDSSVACPAVQPFLIRANLLIRANSDDVIISSVLMQFTDTSGIAAPDVTLTAPVFTRQFGTALVEARSDRSFPLDFRFGCGVGRRGTIVVITNTRDRNGREFTNRSQASVR